MPVGANKADLTQAAGVDDLFRQDVVVPTALLGAGRHDPAGLLHARQQLVSFRQVVGHRFLDIDVFAGRHRLQCHRRVPVVGGGDQHGVDVAAVQEPAVIACGLGLRTHFFRCRQAAGLVDIAGRNQLIARQGRQQASQQIAAPAGPDQTYPDPVVGPQHPGLSQQRRRRRGS